jgi:hypothetical protein
MIFQDYALFCWQTVHDSIIRLIRHSIEAAMRSDRCGADQGRFGAATIGG